MIFTSWTIELVSIALLGLCLGSFLNVLIIRLPRGRSIWSPGSRCGFCRSPIKAWRNIPLISFLLNRGMCGSCGHPYSFRYFFIELLMGVLSVGVWSMYGWTALTAALILFVALLVAISFIDLDFRLIPDELSLGGWAVALLAIAFGFTSFPLYSSDLLSEAWGLGSLAQAIVSSLFGFGIFFILSRVYYLLRGEEGLGGGDVKLMGLVGAVLGLQGVLTTILIGSLLGSFLGIFLVLKGGKTRHFPIPFGPFLALGALAAVFRLDALIWP